MIKPSPPRPPAEVAQLVQMCTLLLNREERHLTLTLAALQEFRLMLANNEPAGLTQALEKIREAAAVAGSIREQRDQFRNATGMLLQVEPSAVCLRLVAEHLPSIEAGELMVRRLRLRELVAEVERVNQGVAVVIWWLLDFVHQVFARIQGNSMGARYSPCGRFQAGVGGPLWQGQG